MGANDSKTGYGTANRWRRKGASEASKRGAIGFMLRSLATNNSRDPHSGALNYDDGVAKIPAVALSGPDADQLERMAKRGKPIRVKFTLLPTFLPQATTYNVVGEIPGRAAPDEVVLVSGHLDSWGLGTGAIDDGAGVAIPLAAAHLAGERHPRRTIRMVMWGAEETDQAGQAYAKLHEKELGRIVVAGESDNGAQHIVSFQVPAGAAELPPITTLAETLKPLGVAVGQHRVVDQGQVGRLQGRAGLGEHPVAVNLAELNAEAVDRGAGDDAVIVGRETLGLHQGHAPAGGAADEQGLVLRPAVVGLGHLLADVGHGVDGAPGEVRDGDVVRLAVRGCPLGVEGVGAGVAAVRLHGGVAALEVCAHGLERDVAGPAAAAVADHAAVPLLGQMVDQADPGARNRAEGGHDLAFRTGAQPQALRPGHRHVLDQARSGQGGAGRIGHRLTRRLGRGARLGGGGIGEREGGERGGASEGGQGARHEFLHGPSGGPFRA